MKLRVRCEDMCAIEFVDVARAPAATTLESESRRRRERGGRTRSSRSRAFCIRSHKTQVQHVTRPTGPTQSVYEL